MSCVWQLFTMPNSPCTLCLSMPQVYNYPKPGAKEMASQAEAQATIAAAQQAAKEIMGLGPGGNVPLPPPAQQQQQRHEQEQGDEADGGRGPGGGMHGGGRGGTGGRGGGRSGRGEGGGGGGRHRYKDQHKGSIANHHRRERALAKQAKGAW